jgi:hypothetical protein
MKQKDLTTIVVIAVTAAVFSLILANVLFGGSKTDLTSPSIAPISNVFKNPSATYFNNGSIDLTQTITIGSNSKTPGSL